MFNSESELDKGADADGGVKVSKSIEERAAIGIRQKRGPVKAGANLQVRARSRWWSGSAQGVAADHGKQKEVEREEKGNGWDTLGTHF